MTWTHNICWRCYKKQNPGVEPARVKSTEIETCCFCGKATKAGIYVRSDPKVLKCTHN